MKTPDFFPMTTELSESNVPPKQDLLPGNSIGLREPTLERERFLNLAMFYLLSLTLVNDEWGFPGSKDV